MPNPMAHQKPREQFEELLRNFSTGMLVSHANDGTPHARPMAVASVEPGSDIWFATGIDSLKASELLRDPRVVVVFQGPTTFLSISGEAQVIVNASRAAELWSEAWRPWFPDGPSDPKFALVHVRPREAEFWNLSGMHGVRYLFDAVRHAIKGERMSDEPADYHARVALP